MVNVSVELWDGSFHEVDSNEMVSNRSFDGYPRSCRRANPVILEP